MTKTPSEGEEDGGDAGVGRDHAVQFLNGEGGGFLGLGLEDLAAPEDVVDQDHSGRRDELQRPPVIVHVVRLVRVDKNQIVRARQPAERLQRRAHADLDLPAVRALVPEPAREGRRAGIDLAGQHRSLLWQSLRHRQRAVAGEGADL